MTNDFHERERALDPAQSFIVQAPAGSGKTGLLTQRFLRLLSVVERPESIVAITFTRKAAAEMRERIIQALEDAAAGTATEGEYEKQTRLLAEAALAQSGTKGWELLVDPGRLQVFTIDALCALLTHQMPILSGFGGEVQVVEDASELRRMAARRTLQKLTEGDEECRQLFREIILYFDNNTGMLESQIIRMLEKRDQWAFLKSDEHPDLVKRFCRLLEEAREALDEVFREQGKVDFGAITDAAVRALGTPENPSDLLYWLDYRIQHLLVDEFQDTSRAQYAFLEALTAQWSADNDHSLLVVGDPMQSIYRFREAEVSLFLRCWEEQMLGAVRLEPVTLSSNFRCTPEILKWVQATFSNVMLEDDQYSGSVQFRPSEAARTDAGMRPQYHWFIDDDGAEEASEVVEVVRRAQAKGTVAILVRSRSHILQILPALREADLTYEAVEIDRLAEQQHVLDIVSLARAILHLGDRVSWLACLRAPWCGLLLADLATLAEGKADRTIFELISDPEIVGQLSPNGRMRVVRFQKILNAAVANAGRIKLRTVIESVWLALGGPSILAEHEREDVATVLDLIEQEEKGGIIPDFSLLNERLQKLFARPTATENCVQVMTIFTAKGLEFDTVILPQLSRTTQGLDKDLLIWAEELSEDGELQLRIAALPQSGKENAEYDRVRDAIKEKEEHELKRVFYVACTRAKNELHLLTSNKSKKDGSGCYKASSGTFLNLIWETVRPDFEAILRRRVAAPKSQPETAASPETPLVRLPADWRLPVFDSSVRWEAAVRPDTASSRQITFEWVRGNARHIGTVVHAFLNRMAEEGLEVWNGTRLRGSQKLIASELSVRGVPAEELTETTRKVVTALANVLDTKRGCWILAQGVDARSEYAIRGRIQDKLITGVIDRMFRDETGRLWIIDYKTGEHKGGSRETFLNEEQRRYRPQLESYATLISRLEHGPIMLGLYFPLMDGWREWEFAEEAALTGSPFADYTGG
ncbi:MAG TPA: UvrD-helicase domain-containing protein [Bryobacteraceae bacterium]|nr:UvrD-helicase domain-containing protein [Bryobacteraceae bacterium]